MKKYNKLFAILFAVLGVTTLKAQVEWTSKTNLLTNPSFETDAAISDLTTCGWATDRAEGWIITPTSSSNAQVGVGNASSKVQGIGSTFSPSEGSNYFYTRNNWNANTEYTISQTISSDLPAGLYKLTCKTATFSSDAKLNTIELSLQEGSNTPVCQNGIVLSVWNTWGVILVKESGDTPLTIKARMKPGYGTSSGKHYAMLLDDFQLEYISPKDFESASVDNPIDFSALINNSTIYNHTTRSNMPRGWTAYKHTTGNGNYTESDKCDTRLEGWSGENLEIDYYQTINNLPPGKYRVKALAQERSGNEKTSLYIYSDPNRATGAVGQAEADYTTEPLAVLNGTANVGIISTAKDWVTADNFRIEYVGEDLSMYQAQYASAKTTAENAIEDEAYSSVTGKEKTDLQTAIDADVEDTKAAYLSAITALETATAAFKAATSDYAILATEKEIAAGLGMTDESIASATAITKTGLVALQDLKVAEYNYIQGTYTENATLGSWTENFAEDLSGEGYKANGSTYFNEWGSATRTAKHTVKLPAGDYAISCIGRGQVGTSGYLYYKVGEETNKVDFIMKGNRGRGVDVDGVANFSDVGLYNCNGEGFGWEYRFITFHLDAKTEVEIGVSATFASAWVSIYAPVLLTTEASVKALRMTEIANLLSTVPTGKMDATVQSTLDEKKDAAEAASAEDNTIDELSTIATELNEAIIDANASIATYKTIATYIAKANNMDESIAAEYQTAYDDGTLESAETVFQELEVATYDYVKDEFSYPVELPAGNWVAEGPTGSKSEQHWSGEQRSYLEQSSTAWGQNAWSISYKQDKTLPAGDYVFKVSGRRAEGTGNTLSLVVTNINDPENPVELGVVNDFPEGDTGLGINKNGETSFDAEDEAGFANDGNGRGWQWRYVKFTLTDETTVQVAVEAEATTNHQWISFCDATLQMTEETYLEANKGALDAPTAEANALVDTNPMGTEENTALKDALALPVTTGAELLAKIEALETAVANANAWVAAYNEAKAPLVAALERFETELNDGVNGCKYNMVEDEDVWATLITEVGEAACTKDVTNDYYSFANAAEKLNNAIDEVHNWIRTNPTLNAKSATAVDMTDYYLMNASFDEGNTNGWEKTGSQTNNVAWSVTDGTFTATPSGSHYTGDAIWQKVNLAKGAYKLTVNLKAQEVAGHPSQVFVAGAAPSWNNNLSDLIASVKVTEFNKDVELSCIFNVATDADVYIGFNQKSGNVAGTGIKGSYTIYDFTLTQAANQIITKDGVITVVGENEATDLAGISSDENIVTVDLTGATWSEASTLSIDNKNSLVYVTDDANLTANNIVKVGVDEEGNTTRVAKSIVLTEGYKFSAREAFTATALNYAREFSANWLTICLPFAYEIPEGVKVETLGAVDLDTKTFTFNEVTGTMEANKPYIIKNSSETAALFAELGDVTVEATPEAMTVEVTAEGTERKAEFIGTYTAVKTDALMENGAYDILFFGSDGQLYFLSQGVTTKNVNIKPFRAYIRLPKDAINWSDGQQAIARHGGGTTDIEDAELTNDGASVIYDLMGRKVNTIEKGGMYIVNGKKVVIR